MSSEFREKLNLYKEGKLDPDEMAKIESEIDKFITISEYLTDDDEEFLEELKQQMPPDNKNESNPTKLLKRRVNLKIIMMTTTTILIASIIIISLFFLASKITTSLFGLNYKESFVQKEIVWQLAKMFNPQYESNQIGVERTLFAQQNIKVSLNNTVGNTKIDETEINVRYSFGNPVKAGKREPLPLILLEDFPLLNTPNNESFPISGFEPLEKAPKGTKAKIFVEFNKTLTAKQLKENFINQLNTSDTTSLDITPVVVIGSKFVLANPSYCQFTPVYPYGSNSAKLLEDNPTKQTQYDNMEDQIHKESLIGNLKLMKDNQKLLKVMYYDDMFDYFDIDDIIEDVENNGAEYVGMYISADREDLLKLKGNPLIRGVNVENIVLWQN